MLVTFCHLNLHTDRSIMRGMIKPASLVAWSQRHNVRAAAVTDYGNVSAAVELYKACKGTNVMPIYGMEVNLVPDKAAKIKGAKRLILLARNRIGFKNLLTIATIGSMYFYYMPRIDLEVIREYSEGLICLTGDTDGIAAEAYFADPNEGLVALYSTWGQIFKEHLYYEIQPVLTESQRVLNEAIVYLYEQSAGVINIVATGDPHYMDESDRYLHENVMAIKQVRNPGWEYPMKGPYHVRTREEMILQFNGLHEKDVCGPETSGFRAALDAPDKIIDSIEAFDLRESVKIPDFIA